MIAETGDFRVALTLLIRDYVINHEPLSVEKIMHIVLFNESGVWL